MSKITKSAGTPAQNFYAAARYFFLGAQAISNGDSELAPACAFLASQSLECVLKSSLSQSGVSEKDLKLKFGHNLEALWVEASSKGVSVSSQPPVWCEILNQTHNAPHYLRYPVGINGFQTPEPTSMILELKRLLDNVLLTI